MFSSFQSKPGRSPGRKLSASLKLLPDRNQAQSIGVAKIRILSSLQNQTSIILRVPYRIRLSLPDQFKF